MVEKAKRGPRGVRSPERSLTCKLGRSPMHHSAFRWGSPQEACPAPPVLESSVNKAPQGCPPCGTVVPLFTWLTAPHPPDLGSQRQDTLLPSWAGPPQGRDAPVLPGSGQETSPCLASLSRQPRSPSGILPMVAAPSTGLLRPV